MIIYHSIMSQFGAHVMKTPGIMPTLTTTCGNNTLGGGAKADD
jgi:hypothetical protein